MAQLIENCIRHILTITVVCLFLAFICFAFAFAVRAQEHRHNIADPDHWYDGDCCDRSHCAPIPGSAVAETPDGYIVTLEPGVHKRWDTTHKNALVLKYPYGDEKIRYSQDQSFHACINYMNAPLCLYIIGGGL